MIIKFTKIALAVLLIICLANMPYGYYQLIRIISTILFCYFSLYHYNISEKSYALLFLFLAILFQPFIKIALGRELWNIVDVIVGVLLIVSVFKRKDNNN